MQREPDVNKVAVIGAGLMGFGIGVDFARAGYDVALWNTREETSKQAQERSRTALSRMVEAEVMTRAEADAALARMHFTTDMDLAAKGADYVIESVLEQIKVKHDVFRRLDELCPPPAILASNSSGIMPTVIAEAVTRPERVLITHYFQPPHLLPLVEIVGGKQTSKETVERTFRILTKMRKKPIVIRKELPAFAGNRIQRAIAEECGYLVENEVCSPEEVDAIIMYSFGRRMFNTGIFIRYDLIGLDFIYDAATARGQKPLKVVEEHRMRGELGVKTGRGIYPWTPESIEALQRRQDMDLLSFLKRDYEEGLL
jgi:3-hydroxybutyryl-CoA dehydrogenase